MCLWNPLWISEQLPYPSGPLSKPVLPSKPPKVIVNVLTVKDGASSTRAWELQIIYSWYRQTIDSMYITMPASHLSSIDYNSSRYFSLYYKCMQMCWVHASLTNSPKMLICYIHQVFPLPKFPSVWYTFDSVVAIALMYMWLWHLCFLWDTHVYRTLWNFICKNVHYFCKHFSLIITFASLRKECQTYCGCLLVNSNYKCDWQNFEKSLLNYTV